GWYDDPGDVPAGFGIVWGSFGTRPNSTTNWTWQTPFTKEGQVAQGLTVSADRSQITYDGSGALSPSSQDTVFTVQGQGLLPFDLATGAIIWTLTDGDGVILPNT